eukprot:1793584-Heterocapsa_arctica.AAC.1
MNIGEVFLHKHTGIDALPLDRDDEEAWAHHVQTQVQMHEACVMEMRERGLRRVGLGSTQTQGASASDVLDLTGTPQP